MSYQTLYKQNETVKLDNRMLEYLSDCDSYYYPYLASTGTFFVMNLQFPINYTSQQGEM